MDRRDWENEEVRFGDFWELGDDGGLQAGFQEEFDFPPVDTKTRETKGFGERGSIKNPFRRWKLGSHLGFLWMSLAGCALFGLAGGYFLASSGVLQGAPAAAGSVQADNSPVYGVDSINSSSSVPTNKDGATNVLIVDVVGDVLHPGLVRLKPDARVLDAVSAAGGFLHPDDANEVNLAAPVNDGDEIIIPTRGSQSPASETGSPSSSASSQHAGGTGEHAGTGSANQSPSVGQGSSLIDLNTADEATLETIPGIGPAKASAIVMYRTEHGRFNSVNDLLKIRGIGAVTLSHIAPYVTIVGGQ